MSIDQDVLGFLSSGAPSVKFAAIGDKVVGTVVAAAVGEQKDLDGNIRTWDDGNVRKQLIITLQTDEGDGLEDDGQRRLFAKGQMVKAVKEAIATAGAKTLEVGGKLAVAYIGDGEPPKIGYHAPKQFKAQYESPVKAAVAASELF